MELISAQCDFFRKVFPRRREPVFDFAMFKKAFLEPKWHPFRIFFQH